MPVKLNYSALEVLLVSAARVAASAFAASVFCRGPRAWSDGSFPAGRLHFNHDDTLPVLLLFV